MLTTRKNERNNLVVIDRTTVKEEVTLVAGVDAGSTETRICLADKRDIDVFSEETMAGDSLERIMTRYVIPSTYATVPDERDIQSSHTSLEANLDSHVILVQNAAENPLISNERILRGMKLNESAGLVLRYLDSSTNKTDNTIFYTNIIDGLGYSIIQKYNGKIPASVDVHLALSVRPKELSQVCRKQMTDNLVGSFIFRWKDVTIGINIVTLTLTTEPEAQIAGHSVVFDLQSAAKAEDYEEAELLSRQFNESSLYMHIEGGGSSIGIEVVKNGDIIAACSSTFQMGGNYLIRVIIDRIREKTGRTASRESVEEAIKTGLLRNGREREDISNLISSCKNQVGLDIVERIRHDVIDLTDEFSLQDVEFITLGGRLFDFGESNVSIGQYFTDYIKQLSPNTDIIILSNNYIPQGNLVIGINSVDMEEHKTSKKKTA